MNTPENNEYDGLSFCEEPGFNGGTPRSEASSSSTEDLFFNNAATNTSDYDGLSLNSAPMSETEGSFSSSAPAEEPGISFSSNTPAEEPGISFSSNTSAQEPGISFSTGSDTIASPSSSYDASYYSSADTASSTFTEAPKASGLSLKANEPASTSTTESAPTEAPVKPSASQPTNTSESMAFNPYSDFDEPYVAPITTNADTNITNPFSRPDVDDGPKVTPDMTFRYYYDNICPFEKKRNIIASSIALELLIGARLLISFFTSVLPMNSFSLAVIGAVILLGLTFGCHFFQNRVCAIFLIVEGVLIGVLPLLMLDINYIGLVFLFLSVQLFRRVRRVHDDFNYDRQKAMR